MANNLQSTPTGIAYYVQMLQVELYNKLGASWGASGLASSQFSFYGISQRNYKDSGYQPEVFTSGKEYQELLFDDRIAALMFFGLRDPETSSDGNHTYKVSLYGFVNLDKIQPSSNGQRFDFQVTEQICNIIDKRFGFTVTDVYRDVKNILSEYSGKKIKEAVKTFNMQPKMCFRIDMENTIRLDLNSTSCVPQIVYPAYYNTMACEIQCIFRDVPNVSLMQTLCNGARIPLEYPTGATVTIPHLIGRYVLKTQLLNLQNVRLPYNVATGTFSNIGSDVFYDGDVLDIEYNETN